MGMLPLYALLLLIILILPVYVHNLTTTSRITRITWRTVLLLSTAYMLMLVLPGAINESLLHIKHRTGYTVSPWTWKYLRFGGAFLPIVFLVIQFLFIRKEIISFDTGKIGRDAKRNVSILLLITGTGAANFWGSITQWQLSGGALVVASESSPDKTQKAYVTEFGYLNDVDYELLIDSRDFPIMARKIADVSFAHFINQPEPSGSTLICWSQDSRVVAAYVGSNPIMAYDLAANHSIQLRTNSGLPSPKAVDLPRPH